MGTEIERKYLVVGDAWRQKVAASVPMAQGYLKAERSCSVRVRRSDGEAFLTIKGPPGPGFARPEFEYPVPDADAEAMLRDLVEGNVVEKTRHLVPFGGRMWEVDEFLGLNEGLIVAELELKTSDEVFDLPPWVGREVTEDTCYSNAELSRRPFSAWGG